jgi:hypothetical protein
MRSQKSIVWPFSLPFQRRADRVLSGVAEDISYSPLFYRSAARRGPLASLAVKAKKCDRRRDIPLSESMFRVLFEGRRRAQRLNSKGNSSK